MLPLFVGNCPLKAKRRMAGYLLQGLAWDLLVALLGLSVFQGFLLNTQVDIPQQIRLLFS